MRIGMGQSYYSDSGTGIETGLLPLGSSSSSTGVLNLNSLPLTGYDTAADIAASMPAVSVIPCESGQTCSYIANVPDWVLYAGSAIAALALFLAFTGGLR
jgi:hypothetical protein